MRVMFCQGAMDSLAISVPYLRRPLPMMRDGLHGFAVLGLAGVTERLTPIVEIIADPIIREDLRGNQARADPAAIVTENKTVEAGLRRGPIFAGRNQDGPARSSGGPAEDKRVDALAAEHFCIGQLPGFFFHDDSREGAASKDQAQNRTGEQFRAGRKSHDPGCNRSETERPAFSSHSPKRPTPAANCRSAKNLKRGHAATNEAK